MRIIRRWVGAVAVVLLVSSVAATPGWAETDWTAYINGSLRKFGRGVANVATCPGEMIRTPNLIGRQDGLVAEFSVGIVQGLWRTVLRGVTGVFEVATFYAEIPKGFEPLMKPEFVWAESTWAE